MSFCQASPSGRSRAGRASAVALAHAHALPGDERALEQAASSGSAAASASASPTEITISGTPALRPEEARAPALAVRGPVDAEQHGRAGDAVAVQRRHHVVRRARRAPCRRSAWRRRPRPAALQSCARARASPARRTRSACTSRQGGLDPLARVDADRDQRQVLRQRQQPVGAQVLLGAEAGRPAQDEAGGEPVGGEDVAQRVGEEAVAGAVALAEVDGQLERRSQRRSQLAAQPHRGDPEHERADHVGHARSPARRPRPAGGSRTSTC